VRYSSSLFMVIYGGTLRLRMGSISRRLSGWALLNRFRSDCNLVLVYPRNLEFCDWAAAFD
jgi:hypothetical protein